MEFSEHWIKTLGMFAALMMPMWNIPFMVRVIRRKSAQDVSLFWLFGIWGCIVLMLPSSLTSSDMVLKIFGLTNAILFTAVVVVVMMVRKK